KGKRSHCKGSGRLSSSSRQYSTKLNYIPNSHHKRKTFNIFIKNSGRYAEIVMCVINYSEVTTRIRARVPALCFLGKHALCFLGKCGFDNSANDIYGANDIYAPTQIFRNVSQWHNHLAVTTRSNYCISHSLFQFETLNPKELKANQFNSFPRKVFFF
ncbi:hypothetical protein V8G54_004225, partial [Vigna mungo]